MKLAILGFAREGRSLLKFLRSRGFSQISAQIDADKYRRKSASHQRSSATGEIWVLDKKPFSAPRGIRKISGPKYLKNLGRFDLVFRSPGIPYELPELRRARSSGVRFSSLTKLFFELARRRGARVIGVTGTKGKGTASSLLYAILKEARLPVFLAGNIGKPALELLPKLTQKSWVVLELSSFQLQDLDVSPEIAIVLDVFPDHQDAHRTLREYYEAKANVARHQRRRGKVFFFKENRMSRWVASKGGGKKIGVSEKGLKLFAPTDLKLPGRHNFRNAAMAASVARNLGVPGKTIRHAVRKFRGLEHRLELARKIGGVSFYNDSASTNPQTSAAAIRAFPGTAKILIAGGQDKGLNYAPLARALKNSSTKLVVLFGENKRKIKKSIAQAKISIKTVASLNAAVRTAYKWARSYAPASVIFSPGAASFDMFENYADRGEKFKAQVRNLTRKIKNSRIISV